jgi:hypothetical protein
VASSSKASLGSDAEGNKLSPPVLFFRKPPPRRKLTPVEVPQRLLRRLEKRAEALRRVKLSGFEIVISEL